MLWCYHDLPTGRHNLIMIFPAIQFHLNVMDTKNEKKKNPNLVLGRLARVTQMSKKIMPLPMI